MVKEGIKIFCRLRPNLNSNNAGPFFIKTPETQNESFGISFQVPKSATDGIVNNKKDVYNFKFNQVFQTETSQDEVFTQVASNVIDNVIEGYNGTIFAYGQTGSGKTYTMTGGTDKYSDRGIIPRTISYIFDYFKKKSGLIFTLHISYMEIYNEHGFDLLNAEHEASRLEDLPRVALMEDSQGCIHLRNLSQHAANSTEEALNWLFMGDTNRVIAETPMNMASTRSHCIFTLHISSREAGSDVIRKSKLHLVDLAGSERVGKSGVRGSQLTEAKYINLSLHYLEQVIISLSEKKGHIPYRNSLMTSVLRDSLGGNCMTSMVATCSVEIRNIDESITTCRFAQRVALVKNEALVNEELDPRAMLARLKMQVSELKQNLQLVTGEERSDELVEEEIEACRRAVDVYLEEKDLEVQIEVSGDMRKIHYCFKLIKERYLNSNLHTTNNDKNSKLNNNKLMQDEGNLQAHRMGVESDLLSMDVSRLRSLLLQRDEEINVIVKLLKQEKENFAQTHKSLFALRERYIEATGEQIDMKTFPLNPESSNKRPLTDPQLSSISSISSSSVACRESVSEEMLTRKRSEFSKARQTAFDTFRRKHPQDYVLNQHQSRLTDCYSRARVLGEKVNASRIQINKYKSQIQQLHISNAVDTQANESAIQTEERLRERLEVCRIAFKSDCVALKELKTEIEHIQHLKEKIKVQMLKEFESWWAEQVNLYKSTVMQENNTEVALSMDFDRHKPSVIASLKHDVSEKAVVKDYIINQDILNKRTAK